MKRQRLLSNLALLLLSPAIFSQDFLITGPRLEFYGNSLSISYELVNKDPSDIFHIWLEMKNQSGTRIRASAVKGDIGDSIRPGTDKKIIWTPEEDAIFLDEDISVELVGERYEKEFNKGSMILLSTAVPGLGQTKISKGKPWWLAGVATYGAVTGGTSYGSSDVIFTSLASVTTTVISNITSTSASSGGTIATGGGASITARGVCWNTSPNPTIANIKTTDGTGTGSWILIFDGLYSYTTYGGKSIGCSVRCVRDLQLSDLRLVSNPT